VNATGGRYGPGIGGGGPSSDITILGGTVTARATNDGAGIGASSGSSAYYASGDITIAGGTITVKGGFHFGAGIGAGAGTSATVKNITITGGTVTASAARNSNETYYGGAGIGAGANGATAQDILITGGTVTATGNNRGGAGIGGGTLTAAGQTNGNPPSTVGNITISGGTVVATRGDANSQDIGNGPIGDADSVTIDGGSVWAANGAVTPAAKNSADANVYANKLSFNPAVGNGTAILAGSIDGVDCALTPNAAGGVYGINGVKTLASGTDAGKVSLWLPARISETDDSVNLGTQSGAIYGLAYERADSAPAEQTLALPPTPNYIVYFDLNGVDATFETPATNPQIIASGGTATNPLPGAMGYEFLGWYANSDFSGSAYDFGTTVTSGITLYAKWDVKSGYTVKYDTGVVSGVDDKTGVEWTDSGLPPIGSDAPKRTGYKLAGWYVSGDIDEKIINVGDAYGDLANSDAANSYVTLVAKWTAKSVSVTYIYNGSTAYTNQNADVITATKIASGDYDSAPEAAPNPDPTREGYTFVGWYADLTNGDEWVFDASTGTALTAENGVTNADRNAPAITLYAKWYANVTGVEISGTAKVGQTLTANVTPAGATVSYVWKSGGEIIDDATASAYTPKVSDVGNAITVTVTGMGSYDLEVSSDATTPVINADGAAITVPAKAADGGVGVNSITINAAKAAVNPGEQDIEYAINQSGTDAPTNGWSVMGAEQTTLTFSELLANRDYCVWARTKAQAGYNTGAAVASAKLKTGKISIAGATVAVDVSFTYNGAAQIPDAENVSVTLSEEPLDGETDYTFVAANNTNAGDNTATVTVTGDGDYTGTATGTFDIARKQLTISGVGASDKVYDGGAEAQISGDATLDGVVTGDEDDVTLVKTEATASFDDADVGTDKTVSFSGFSLSGEQAGNYSLTQPGDAEADITARPLGVTGITAEKVYDGDGNFAKGQIDLTYAQLGGIDSDTAGGVITADESYVLLDDGSCSGTVATKDAETGKTLAVAGLALKGSKAGNYSLAAANIIATADITQKQLTATAQANDKSYDGTNVATPNITPSGVVGSDSDVSVFATARFAQTNVGDDITVTFTDIKLGGADSGNYIKPASIADSTADITKADAPFEGSKITITLVLNDTGAKAFDLSTMLPTFEGGYAAMQWNASGGGEYVVGTPVEDNDVTGNVLSGAPSISGSTLSYTVAEVEDDDEVMIPVTYKSGNFKDVTLELTVQMTAKTPLVITADIPNDLVYTGDELDWGIDSLAFEGDGDEVELDEDEYSVTVTPAEVKNAGNYTVTVSANTNRTGEQAVNYKGSETFNFNIAQASKVSETDFPKGFTLYVGDRLSDITLTSVEDAEWSWKAGGDTPITATMEYTLILTPEDTANYKTQTELVQITAKPLETFSVIPGESSFTYDGDAHSPSLTVTDAKTDEPVDGAVIKWGTTPEDIATGDAPDATEVKDGKTVYWQVSATHYATTGGSITLTIEPKSVSVSDITATKEYTGTDRFGYNRIDITKAKITGVIDGDKGKVSLADSNYSGTVADANVGEGKNLTVTDLALAGAKAGNYSIGSISATASITTATQGALAIKLGDVTSTELSKTYGENGFSLTAVGGSGTGAYLWESSNEDVATITSAGAVAITGVGSAEITLGKAADGNYAKATDTSLTLVIGKAESSVTAPTGATGLIYTGAELNLLAANGSTSDGTLKYAVTAQGANEPEDSGYDGEIPMAENAGSYAVYYKVFGDANHNDSAAAHITVKIAKADNLGFSVTQTDIRYGAEVNPAATGNQGAVAYKYKEENANSETYTNEKPTSLGSYTVQATDDGGINYNQATATDDFTIDKANITSTVAISNWTYGETPSEPSVSANPEDGDVAYAYSDAENGTYEETQPTDAGTYWVKADIDETDNYNSTTTAAVEFTIAEAKISAVITGVKPPVVGEAPTSAIAATDEYTATISWNPGDASFAYNKVYTATITLTPKMNYTLQGVTANSFTVAGATSVKNAANSGVITAEFQKTPAESITVNPSLNISGAPKDGKFAYKASGNNTLSLKATVNPSGAVTWKSSNPKIATVNAAGLVTFVGAEGSVIITATAVGSSAKPATVTINSVKNVTGIRTPLATVYIQKGKSLTLPVVLDDSTNKKIAVTSKLTWKSSNTKAVTVKNGKITVAKNLKKKTTVKITVTAANGKSKVINVIAVPKATKLKKVTAKMPKKNTLGVGKFHQFNVKLSSAAATGISVTFKSSKASVLKVDKAGKLIALKKGTATITIKAGSKSIKQKITVK
jgi:uncharacterized repeat protein (TIGR02543 family)